MHDLVHDKDWSGAALGAREGRPQSLRD